MKTLKPQSLPLNQFATPTIMVNMTIEPMKGQRLWCGT